MKKWRFLGIDDSFDDRRCCLVGCVVCSGYVEGFMYSEIAVDGLDATDKIISMILRSKFRNQIKCIFMPGITFGGFNIADIHEVHAKTGIPVVVVMRRKPRMDEFFSAMENVDNTEVRKRIVEKAGEIYKLGSLYLQLAGIELEKAEEFLRAATVKGNIPEAVRVAHLAASAIIHGESRGKI